MQRLTAMTIGAAMLALCGFVYDANAQPPSTQAPAEPAVCPTHDVTVYFAPGSSELSSYAQSTLDMFAHAASSCGARGVVLVSTGAPDRTEAVADALKARGVAPMVSRGMGITPVSDGVAARSVTLRVAHRVGASS